MDEAIRDLIGITPIIHTTSNLHNSNHQVHAIKTMMDSSSSTPKVASNKSVAPNVSTYNSSNSATNSNTHTLDARTVTSTVASSVKSVNSSGKSGTPSTNQRLLSSPATIATVTAAMVGASSSSSKKIIQRNPRDAASPRRSRQPSQKSKSMRDYEHTVSSYADQDSLSTSHSLRSGRSASHYMEGVGASYSPKMMLDYNSAASSRFSSQYFQSAMSVGSKSASNKSKSNKTIATAPSRVSMSKRNILGPAKEEQRLFEQRLCDENYGVAVRKIHSNGKSQLRYVKCIPMDAKMIKSQKTKLNMSHSLPVDPAARVIAKGSGSISPYAKNLHTSSKALTKPISQDPEKQYMALSWGHKKTVPLLHFTEVRKGKTTDRTKRNPNPSSKLLSLITKDKRHGSLDIEAPTQLDRDKFAKAFSVFLGVPLIEDLVGQEVRAVTEATRKIQVKHQSDDNGVSDHGGEEEHESNSLGASTNSSSNYSSVYSNTTPHGMKYMPNISDNRVLLPSLHSSPSSTNGSKRGVISHTNSAQSSLNELDFVLPPSSEDVTSAVIPPAPKSTSNTDKEEKKKNETNDDDNDDDLSAVSSLTQGFDQEIVEELHQEINELRAELEASRAEAARAVKVAEQAIQSAEACSSNDWNSTVTHKAAEAAALAQKRSAEAIAKQRQAEEKLAAERKSASFWRNQAQKVEDEVSALKTRLAVAQVQRTSVTEELDRERRKAASYIQTMKKEYIDSEAFQREMLASTAEQNRLLEIELDGTRQDYLAKDEELKSLQENILELQNELAKVEKGSKKKLFCKPKFIRGESLLLETDRNSTTSLRSSSPSKHRVESIYVDDLLKLQVEAQSLKKHFEILKRTTAAEFSVLPEQAKEWSLSASRAINEAQNEVTTLKMQLAVEMANRRKLLHEVQDLRGVVRVYCRPKPLPTTAENPPPTSILSVPSNDVLLLHRSYDGGEDVPICFEFDRMFPPLATQSEVYSEFEELVLGGLDGFNSCLIAYGSSGSGKTHSLIGDYEVTLNEDEDAFPTVEIIQRGIHLMAVEQLFQVAADRRDRFEDSFSISIMEVYDEKIFDLLAHSDFAKNCGVIKGYDGRNQKTNKKSGDDGSTLEGHQLSALEIRTNYDGDTFVQGLVSIPVDNYDEVLKIWQECLIRRASRAKDLGMDFSTYEESSHLIATIEIVSTNISTGIGTVGKVQFADLAGSDAIQRRSSITGKSRSTGMDDILAPIGNESEWKFVNKSISTLADVVNAKVNFSRDVPYGNSTITHVLRDALEADTKTLLLACVSSNPKDLQATANTLRFASKMRQLVIGKATRRHITIA